MPDRVRVLLLCEDRDQENFFRRICRRFDKRPRVRIAPRGIGSAERWVRENFADELKAQRKYAQERVGLVVVVDGDVQGVAARKKQLDDAAINAGLQKRKKSERVAICVPTRNIETWVVAICRDGDFNETDDYKQTVTPEEYRKAPRIWLGNENACPLPSCLDARQEFTRLDGQRP